MAKIQNRYLNQLLMQEKFVPAKKKKQQLIAAEELYNILEDEKDYPFEFICYKITGFHPKGLEDDLPAKGKQLKDDLRIFINKVSSQVAERTSQYNEDIYTVDQLAGKLDVSKKTVNRWRKKGLLARKFIFPDNKKKIGITESALKKFRDQNPELIENAAGFCRMSKRKRTAILKHLRKLAEENNESRNKIIEQSAKKYARSHEAVRKLLAEHEKNNPDNKIFKDHKGPLTSAQKKELYRLYCGGTSIKKLITKFGKSKSTVYRVINRKRAKKIALKDLNYIPSQEFLREDADQKILTVNPDLQNFIQNIEGEENLLTGSFSTRYLNLVENLPKLNREMEQDLFRRYNYLKYLAEKKRKQISNRNISGRLLTEIEELLNRIEKIKQILIKANLKMVVTIARKHSVKGRNLSELVSQGNVALMKAIEKFDYNRGFRFSTYASWVITTDFAKKLPEAAEKIDKAFTASLESIQKDHRKDKGAGVVVIERARESLVETIKNELDEREQYIILNHFGLIGSPVHRKRKTLKEVGDHLGLTKERVRQLELLALQKLKRSLSMEEFELLTG